MRLKKPIFSPFTIIISIVLILIIIYMTYMFIQVKIQFSNTSVIKPQGPVVLTNLTSNEIRILQEELVFEIPEGAEVVGAAYEQSTSVCFKGIKNVDEFVRDYAFVEYPEEWDASYYSSIQKLNFESVDCYYFGSNEKEDYISSRHIVSYYHNNVYYVELSSPGITKEETYDMFFNRQEIK